LKKVRGWCWYSGAWEVDAIPLDLLTSQEAAVKWGLAPSFGVGQLYTWHREGIRSRPET